MREQSETVGLYLDREREGELAERSANGCVASRSALVESNLAFVVRIAKEYRNLGVPFEDLLEEGNLGLLEAACRFDGTRGTRFPREPGSRVFPASGSSRSTRRTATGSGRSGRRSSTRRSRHRRRKLSAPRRRSK